MKKTLLILTLIGFLTIPSFAQGNSWNGGNGKGKHGSGWGIGFNGGIAELINKLPHEELSDEEIWGMNLYVRGREASERCLSHSSQDLEDQDTQ
jgi:hypothetical protein